MFHTARLFCRDAACRCRRIRSSAWCPYGRPACEAAEAPPVGRTRRYGTLRVSKCNRPGTIDNDRLIRFGGIGSDIFHARGDSANEFWMVTDRGPNWQPGGRRTFPVPELKVRRSP